MTNIHLLSLDYRSVYLSYPNYKILSLNTLESMADYECSRFLKEKKIISESTGWRILKDSLRKQFFVLDESEIFIRNNISDFLLLFPEGYIPRIIKIPYKIKTLDSIYDYIDNFLKSHNEEYFYIIDKWGLNYAKLKYKNLIIFSSIEDLYGISDLNLCWSVINNKEISEKLNAYFNEAGSANSTISQIYSLIVIKNSDYILEKKKYIYESNRKKLEIFIQTNYLVSDISDIYPKAIVKIPMSKNFIEFCKTRHGIILESEDEDSASIYFGTKTFQQEIVLLQEAIDDFREKENY